MMVYAVLRRLQAGQRGGGKPELHCGHHQHPQVLLGQPLRALLGEGRVTISSAAVHGLWPRIRLIACADSSDFTKNPAAGLWAISSA
jgi:hypothetical protein